MKSRKIAREIRRTIQTAPYESLVITETQEEHIEFETEEEFNQRSKEALARLVESFKFTHDYELEELGLKRLKKYSKKMGSTEFKDSVDIHDILEEFD